MVYHILNGDALAQRFPTDLKGELIVFRECLVSGPNTSSSHADLYKLRKTYLHKLTGGPVDYDGAVVTEFDKILDLTAHSEINLWFEYDLFCQVNLWYILYLLSLNDRPLQVRLVLPDDRSPYGFHQYSNEELKTLYNNYYHIKITSEIGQIWEAYVNRDAEQIRHASQPLTDINPALSEAIELQQERIQLDDDPIVMKLKVIVNELNSDDFGNIFRQFQKRHPYYGLGDLQVKSYVDRL